MQTIRFGSFAVLYLCVSIAAGSPAGFVKTTIPLDAPPVGLAFDEGGVLFALEGATFGSNEATLRRVLADGTVDPAFSIPVFGDDSENFFSGGMAYDPVTQRLLITDNTADGRLYAIDVAGNQQTIATGIAGVASVAVRPSGEIFVSTAPFGDQGQVLLIDPATNINTPVMTGLGYGAGLAFDLNDDLIVQDAGLTFEGRLQRLPITEGPSGLEFGVPMPVVIGAFASAGVMVDSEGDIFTTGSGGLYRVAGTPPTELPFDNNGSTSQFATAISFDAGSQPFEPFQGPGGGRLAYMAEFGFASQDSFITMLTPARPGDYNGDGDVDDADHSLWVESYGSTDDLRADGDLDGSTTAADYVVWQKFAQEIFVLSAGLGASSVPEPALTGSAAMLVFSVAMFGLRRRNHELARFGPRRTTPLGQ
jgi:hypothetical protein